MKQKSFSIGARAKSFGYAWSGLRALLASEHNMYIHLALTLTTMVGAAVFHVRATDVMLLIFAIALVWMAELFNTSIEKTADLISKEHHPQIKFLKDVSAAAVLVASLAAFAIGCLVFIPKIFF